MTTLINHTLVVILGLYLIYCFADLIIRRSFLSFAVQFVILVAVFLVLNLTTGFPVPRVTFGPASIEIVLVIVGFGALGIAANYFFYLGARKIRLRNLLRPLFIAPIIVLPLLGSITSAGELTELQLISFSFLSFQNGFFWKMVLENARPTEGNRQ